MTGPVLIDARGLLCPLPVLRLRKALESRPTGAQVRLIATDAMAAIDVPHFCATAGHRLVQQRDAGNGVLEFTVARGLSAPAAASGLAPEDV